VLTNIKEDKELELSDFYVEFTNTSSSNDYKIKYIFNENWIFDYKKNIWIERSKWFLKKKENKKYAAECSKTQRNKNKISNIHDWLISLGLSNEDYEVTCKNKRIYVYLLHQKNYIHCDNCKNLALLWSSYTKEWRCSQHSGSCPANKQGQKKWLKYTGDRKCDYGCGNLANFYKPAKKYKYSCSKSPQDCPKTQNNIMTKSYYWKFYTMPSGKKVSTQGFEAKALDYLLDNGYSERDISCHKKVPSITYTDINNVTKRHYPDIFLPKENTIIEVKSDFTYQKDVNAQLKKNAAEGLGYSYYIWVFSKRGTIPEGR
jgi:hypothetical protein